MALILEANVDCESCGATFTGTWHDDSDTVQDMAEPPVAEQVCPECGNSQEETYSGWTAMTEAG